MLKDLTEECDSNYDVSKFSQYDIFQIIIIMVQQQMKVLQSLNTTLYLVVNGALWLGIKI